MLAIIYSGRVFERTGILIRISLRGTLSYVASWTKRFFFHAYIEQIKTGAYIYAIRIE